MDPLRTKQIGISDTANHTEIILTYVITVPFRKVYDSEPWSRIPNLLDRFFENCTAAFQKNLWSSGLDSTTSKLRGADKSYATGFENLAFQKHHFTQKYGLRWRAQHVYHPPDPRIRIFWIPNQNDGV